VTAVTSLRPGPIWVTSLTLASYVIGSVPTGYWLGRSVYKIDVRTRGSGNLGATNVYRVLGPLPGITTLLLDIVKGMIPVLLARHVFQLLSMLRGTNGCSSILAAGILDWNDPCGEWIHVFGLVRLEIVAGLSAIVGHSFSFFVRFRGGKGVATSAGVFLAIVPKVAGIAIAIFALVLAVTRYVSISSILAAAALAAAAVALHAGMPIEITSLAIFLFVLWTHRANMRRLMNGTEHRMGGKRQETA